MAYSDKVLEKAKLKINDIDLFELNEAFSVVGLANIKILDIDKNKASMLSTDSKRIDFIENRFKWVTINIYKNHAKLFEYSLVFKYLLILYRKDALYY